MRGRMALNEQRLKKLSSSTDLEKRVAALITLGSRETGSPPHVKFIDQIAGEITALGLPVYRDSYRFDRWSVADRALDCELTVEGKPVTVASAYPYSGRTGTNAFSGKLALAGCRPWAIAGKIAVFAVPYPKVPIKLLIADADKLGAGRLPKTIAHPVLAATALGPDLVAAKAAGAIGVIAVWRRDATWRRDGDMTPELAADQYVPFTFPYRDIPALWVAGDEGEQLLKDARRGASATLKLNAALVPGAVTDTVWTVIKGKSNTESTLVVTHTDGVNVIEENGPLGVLELARMFAGEGEPPQRTLVFVFVTGHLRIPAVTRHGQATTAWLTAHRQWWAGDNNGPRAVAGLVIEHLGARAADGIPELAYTTNTTMRKVLERWEKANPTKGVTVVARPRLLQIGEGEPLYQHGIPAISLASVPNYLLQTSSENFLDADLLHSQVDTLARALLALDATPASEIGPIKRMTLCKTLATWLRLARFILGDARLRAHVRRVACLKLGSWAMVAVRWLTGGSNPRRAP